MIFFNRHMFMIVVFILFSVQSAHAENAIQKTLQLLKETLQSQQQSPQAGSDLKIDSANDELFGQEVKSAPPSEVPLWNNKTDFLAAVSRGEMAGYSNVHDNKEKNIVINSIKVILTNDYQTPVPNKKEAPNCVDAFQGSVDSLLKMLTQDKIARLGQNPPDFIATSSADIREKGNGNLSHLNRSCGKEVLGKNIPYPFINSLKSLLKEYADTTESYVNKIRVEKVAAYKIVQQQEADSATRKAEQEKQEKQHELEQQAKQQAKDEFEKKELNRIKACGATSAYKRYTAGIEVQGSLSLAKDARQEIKKEQDIGKVSGYVNSSRLNELGRMVVNSEDRAKTYYAAYRKNGGTASSIDRVVSGINPCQ